MQICPCCYQRTRYLRNTEYKFSDVCFKDGEFYNDLPDRMAIVSFNDGAKIPVMLHRITERFLVGQKDGAGANTFPVSFRF